MEIGLACEGDQRSDTAIVFAADGNYLRFAAFAAAQIVALAPQRRFDVCLCIPAEAAPVAGLDGLGARIARIDTGGVFAPLGRDSRRTEAAYLRLALPAAFAGAYRRLLYLDADVFVQGGDFAALLDVDIGPHPLAAVRDNIQWRTPGRRAESFRRLGLRAAPVFNSGVLLIDVAAFNAQEVLERCLAFGRQPPAGAHRARPGPAERGAARRLGRDLAGLELAVHLGVAALRGDGGRARGALHRAEEALEPPGGRAAAALSPRLPPVLRRALSRGADRRGRGGADGEPRLPAAEPRQASALGAQDERLSGAVPDRSHRLSLISTSAGRAG